jgi:tRNA A-37 threonylcarbamoyl transferase component Bud32
LSAHDDAPTVVDGKAQPPGASDPPAAAAARASFAPTPSHVRRSRPGSGPAAQSIAHETAVVALHAEEATRTSAFGKAVALLAVAGLVVHLTLFHGGVPLLHHLMTGALVASIVGGAAVWRVARDPARYSYRVTVAFGLLAITVTFIFELYLGVFSPFPCIVALGLCIFGLVDSTRMVIPMCVVACALYFGVASAVTFGAVRDPGLFSAVGPSASERLGMSVMVLAVYAAAMWVARSSRRATRDAIAQSHRALLDAQQQHALLAEANQNLDAALQAGAGRSGRYTGAVVGSFELGAVVGRGAMGEVYAAEHTGDRQPAAVKLLHARVLGDASLVKRFLREAEITKKLRSPNIVEVLEAGEAPDGAPYLAMELLVGRDLAWHLRHKRKMPVADAVVLVEQVARGLEAAHDAGIVHRDLKPQNLLLHEAGAPAPPTWKILDFGVSKLRDSAGTLTEGAIVGTPGYMAPEQVRSGLADARADIFALGAVTYRALTGQPAFPGQDVQALFDVVYKQPSAPSEIVSSLPRDVDRVLAIALAKKQSDRFARPREFADALRAASHGELADDLRARADALIRDFGWGKTRQAS